MKRPAIVIALVIAILGVAIWGASRPANNNKNDADDSGQTATIDGGSQEAPKVEGSNTDQPAPSTGNNAATAPVTSDVAAANGWVSSYRTTTPSVQQASVSPQPSTPAPQAPTPPAGGQGGGDVEVPAPQPTVKKVFNKPLISIEFDDNWLSGYTDGLPVVESFGWKATVNVYTESVTGGFTGYTTAAQLADVYARGHDLGAHTVTHTDLTTLDQAARLTEMTQSKAVVEGITTKPVDYLVTPYCASNEAVVADATTAGFTAVRNCNDTGVNVAAGFDAMNVQSYNVLRTDSTEKIQGLIDQAVATNGWLVLVYHEVSATGDDHSIAPAALTEQLQAVKDSGVEVVKTADVLAEIAAPVAQP